MDGQYILIGQTPVLCDDLLTWGRWFEDRENDRIVKQETVLGICWVSTAFLGLDHSFSRTGPPVLFETMAFWAGEHGEEQDRCSTWLEAERMHRRMVAKVARPRTVLRYIGRTIREYWKEAREDWGDLWREKPWRSESDEFLNSALDLMEKLKKRQAERDDWSWVNYG